MMVTLKAGDLVHFLFDSGVDLMVFPEVNDFFGLLIVNC